MALTLNAEQKSIYDIFSGENQYIIPPYQRAYSWTNVQCKALFEDIKKAFYDSEQEGYFLGNIVLAKSREERNKLEVIDGQQRLTTLILLIKVLLSFDKENKALYNAIWIKDRRTDEEIQRLETNVFMEKDFNYFKEVLAFDFSESICDSVNKKDNFFKQNICYFYHELQEFSRNNDIFKFADFLLDRIYILPIETEDIDADKARKNALQIFETINNRGLNLSISDIFKARLYSLALNELKHKEFIERWRELEQKSIKLEYSVDDIFEIYSYIVLGKNRISKKISLKKVFLEEYYSPFKNKKYNEIFDDLFKIINSIEFFNKVIKNPKKENEELTKWFQIINEFSNNRDSLDHILLFVYLSQKELKKTDELIEFCKSLTRYIVDILLHPNDISNDVIAVVNNNFTYPYIHQDGKILKIACQNLQDYEILLLGLYLKSNIKPIYPYLKNIKLQDILDFYDYTEEEYMNIEGIVVDKVVSFLGAFDEN